MQDGVPQGNTAGRLVTYGKTNTTKTEYVETFTFSLPSSELGGVLGGKVMFSLFCFTF